MPTPKRERTKILTVELPEEMVQRLADLLTQTGRPLDAELRLAVEFWLDRQGFGESAVEPPPRRKKRGQDL